MFYCGKDFSRVIEAVNKRRADVHVVKDWNLELNKNENNTKKQ